MISDEEHGAFFEDFVVIRTNNELFCNFKIKLY